MTIDMPSLAEIIVCVFDEVGEGVVIGAVVFVDALDNFSRCKVAVVNGDAGFDEATDEAYPCVGAAGRVDIKITVPVFI